MQSVFYILQNTLNDCSASEKCIGEYIIANSPAVLSMTISELAKEANGSTAAVIRLCKRLNIDGFQELKILLAKDVYSQKKETTYSDFTFSQEDGTSGILDKVLHMNQVNLENISKVLNPSSIDTAVKKINDARFVHIAGVGASALPALDLHQKLSRIGKLSVFEQDSQMQMTAACTLTCDDVAVIFSYSGETDEVIKGAKIAKKEGAFCIAVTHAGGSAL
ncbi:MAG: MurR/RpiR family transcriptional regulator, partial [Spirochaetales bacterium]